MIPFSSTGDIEQSGCSCNYDAQRLIASDKHEQSWMFYCNGDCKPIFAQFANVPRPDCTKPCATVMAAAGTIGLDTRNYILIGNAFGTTLSCRSDLCTLKTDGNC
ncbi:hypothetical protein WN48_00218 [Eufriesea mexicana]|uniref:Uncharacterized protein n=1 Tax=Eufriesea mexicana TaxID=516756 RepID=A0A310SET7_9HYME|nr:hypothetical protein WN48_00218 [Eufriesea mexicana]